MATTNIGVNDALAVKLWSKSLDSEALKFTDIAPLIGDDANSIIHRKTETSKGPGDQVTYGLRMQLNQPGFTENQLAEGNGESLSIYSDSLVINELMFVVGVKSDRTIDAQRVQFDLREEARDGLSDLYAKRYSQSFFYQVCGYTPQTDIRYTGLQATIAASSTRIIRQSARTDDASLTSSDTFTLSLVDKAKELAITATPKMRPIKVMGRDGGKRDYDAVLTDKYVMYLHPYQVTDLKLNSSTGQWSDIQKAAMMGGDITGNPLYTGALGEWNGVILRQSFDIGCSATAVPNGVANAGTAVANVARAVLLGGQAAMIAFGQKDSPSKYRWNEELFDHKRRLEISAATIHGLKKTRFNSTDYGTVVVSTYAAAHT